MPEEATKRWQLAAFGGTATRALCQEAPRDQGPLSSTPKLTVPSPPSRTPDLISPKLLKSASPSPRRRGQRIRSTMRILLLIAAACSCSLVESTVSPPHVCVDVISFVLKAILALESLMGTYSCPAVCSVSRSPGTTDVTDHTARFACRYRQRRPRGETRWPLSVHLHGLACSSLRGAGAMWDAKMALRRWRQEAAQPPLSLVAVWS